MKRTTAALLLFAQLTAGCATTVPGGPSTTAATVADAAPDHPLKAWLREHSRSKKGAVIGAIAGAAGGYLRARLLGQDPLKGAAAGAVAGAIAGYLIGRRQDTLYGSRDEAIARLAYEPAQGYVLAVEEVRFEPAQIAPGGTAHVYVRYLVVGPRQDENLTVKAFTAIKYDGQYMNAIGPDALLVPRGGGIVETRSAVTVPRGAPAGSYSIEALFEDVLGRFQSSREQPLFVG